MISLSDFGIRQYWPLIILYFLKNLLKIGIISFFKYVIEFTDKVIWAWPFFLGSVLITNSIYLLVVFSDSLFLFDYLFVFLKEIFHFT